MMSLKWRGKNNKMLKKTISTVFACNGELDFVLSFLNLKTEDYLNQVGRHAFSLDFV